jgi:hypothetical protein
MGVDWKLIHSDNFNRYRIGDEWKGLAVHYMSQKLSISDGAMTPEASMAFMLYDKKIKLPVRIEFDVFAGGDKRNMTGVQLSPSGLAMRTFWHKLVGRGYYLSLGWHDAKNNRVIRDTETVLLDTKGLQLETGKWYHVTAQFVPPHCQIYVDGALVMDYKDPNFLPGLDQIGLHSIPQQKFDNVRIYEQK